MKIVVDTNILVSAIFFDGLPEKLVDLILTKVVTIVVSHDLLQEYAATIQNMYGKLAKTRKRFSLAPLLKYSSKIKPTSKIQICRDKDDNKFIDCAVDGNCEYIVSGDKDLLSLRNYQNINIVTVRDFLKFFEKQS
ncbi:MAG: putative toxin-antitoxin system toxin component, PIN family [Candidatus Margulisbacteria bacterium]|jgi:putative PIN family toxin of toxin-antitoxin system|nr:putative toxin-antitoxin system toxin component, PIN family [Candidatus Margulisiibacteriota bacterium]